MTRCNSKIRLTMLPSLFLGTQILISCEAVEEIGKGVGAVLTGLTEEVGKAGKEIISFPTEVSEYDEERTEVARLLQQKQQLQQQIEDKEHPQSDPHRTLPVIKGGAW